MKTNFSMTKNIWAMALCATICFAGSMKSLASDNNNDQVISWQSGLKLPQGVIPMSSFKKQAENDVQAREAYEELTTRIAKSKAYRQKLMTRANDGKMKHKKVEPKAAKYAKKLFKRADITLEKDGIYRLPNGSRVIEDGDYSPLTEAASSSSVLKNLSDKPENHAPVMERDKSPNYTVPNENTWPVFTNVYRLKPQIVPGNPNPRYSFYNHLNNRHYVSRGKDCTYVTETHQIYWDWHWFNFPSTMKLIDSESGKEYMLRYVEHFPLDTKLWIHGQSGEFVRFVYVFPPLPEEVTKVDFVDGFVKLSDRLSNSGSPQYIEELDVHEKPQ